MKTPYYADRLEHALKYCRKRFRQSRVAYLYVLECQGFIKIGVAEDVKQRVSNMQVGCPFPICVISKQRVANPYDKERVLHQALKEHRTTGEWFKVDAGAVESLIATLTD